MVLGVTQVAVGLMFHILSIIVILILGGVFLHSVARMIMLQKRRKARKCRRRTRRENGNQCADERDLRHGLEGDDAVPDSPIQVTIVGDETSPGSRLDLDSNPVEVPPPIYGNFRTSRVSISPLCISGSGANIGKEDES